MSYMEIPATSSASRCPFHQAPRWENRKVTIEKVDHIPHIEKSFYQIVCEKVSYVWEVIVNTYQAIFHLGSFDHDRTVLTTEFKGQYKEIIPFNSMIRETYLSTDPVINEAVLNHPRNGTQDNDLFYRGLNIEITAAITGNHNPITAGADEHEKLRAFLQPFFEFKVLRLQVSHFIAQTQAYAAGWEQADGHVNITHEMHRFGLEALSKHFFGFTEPTEDILEAIDTIGALGVKNYLWRPGCIKFIENSLWNEAERLRMAHEKIEKAVEHVCANESSTHLLGAMQKAVDDNGEPLFTRTQILDTVKLLFLAGQETSASLLIYLIYTLGTLPEWRQKLREDLDKLQKDGKTFEEAIIHSQVLQRIFKEGLRLNPPVQVISRTLKQNAVIRNEKNEEIYVKAGKTLNCENYFSLRDERRWGADPEVFNPDRHEHKGENSSAKEKGPWLVFSAGSESCLGRQFATLEVKTVLATLVQNFDWEPVTRSVKQTGHFTCRLEADHQANILTIFQKLTRTTPSSDVFVRFTRRVNHA